MKFKRDIGIFVLFGILAGGVASVVYRQDIADWYTLRSYLPPAKIEAIADSARFTDPSTRLFYVHAPELLDKDNFLGKCSNDEETIVLGCYKTNDKIYILDVEDARLEGVEEVTAAHEMLHAAYDRLSASERSRIDALTASVFQNTTNERLRRTIESYRQRDPSVVPNELHSILPTEIRELPQELEEYYQQYFTDRTVVVTLAEAYAAEFTSRESTILEFDTQLNQLKPLIDQNQASVDQLQSALNFEQKQLEQLIDSPEEYNNAVPSYNAKVREYNTLIATLKQQINQYNIIVAERNKIALEEKELVEAIDTRDVEL